MSFAQLLSELPHLTRKQRELVVKKISALDEGLWLGRSTSPQTRAIVDQRLAALGQGEQWLPWNEARRQIARRLNKR